MEIGSEEFGNEVAGELLDSCTPTSASQVLNIHILERRDKDITERDDLHGVSAGAGLWGAKLAVDTHILVPEMLQQLQFSVGPFSQDRSAERLHNLLDGDILVRELVSGGTGSRYTQSEPRSSRQP